MSFNEYFGVPKLPLTRPWSKIFDKSKKSKVTVAALGRRPAMFDWSRNFSTTVEDQSNAGRKFRLVASTPVKLFDYEQLGEASGQVRPQSKIFDPSRAEAAPPESGLGPIVVAKDFIPVPLRFLKFHLLLASLALSISYQTLAAANSPSPISHSLPHSPRLSLLGHASAIFITVLSFTSDLFGGPGFNSNGTVFCAVGLSSNLSTQILFHSQEVIYRFAIWEKKSLAELVKYCSKIVK
ncbi:hypothetical protein TorRG33x02_292320 [Trema orientale]|uniref:Uncharacterized protein n=1 Tax=Trema orientale TaxID=63057 RepID=A0A2P5CAA9_TREOI|nr:hypothetical protein TorRG33x02_292320 [Trema orientale]